MTNDIMAAVQSVVATASGETPLPYIPTTIQTEDVLFMYAEPPTDEIVANNIIRRTFHISLWCLVQYVSGDDSAADAKFNDLTDNISLALAANKTLNGTVRSTTLADINHNPLIEVDRVIFRARLWSLAAWVDIGVTMQ
ncbi:MAG TPA: hypothetical protein VIG47_15575 [Gemmatimonadaceae bacterium]